MNYTMSQFYSKDRIPLGKLAPLRTPLRMAISTSEICNIKCRYCFRSVSNTIDSGYTTEKFMSWDIFKLIVKQTKEFIPGVKKIFFNVTGEPLCNNELSNMIKYFKEEIPEPVTSIQTNGLLLNEEIARNLSDSGLDNIMISLQGISKEKYKSICGANIDLEKFISNIAYLYEIKNKLKLYVKIPDISLDTGDEILFHNIFDSICDQAVVERIVPDFAEVDYSKIEGIAGETTNRFGSDYGKQKVCPYAFYSLAITTNGEVYPCIQSKPPYSMGNINNNSLIEIWNGKIWIDLLKKKLTKSPIQNCDTCSTGSGCVKSQEDIIDPYCEEILQRIIAKEKNNY